LDSNRDPSINAISYEEDWLEKFIEKEGKENLQLKQSSEGMFDFNKSVRSRAYLFNDYSQTDNAGIYHSSYLDVETGNKVFLQSLPSAYADNISTVDIDGDKIDEIIIQSTVGMSGGAGQYVSQVLKVSDKGLEKVFCFSAEEEFNTGFECTIQENFVICIKNTFTKYETVIDFSKQEKYLNLLYDEDGRVINKIDILCDSFYEFIPKDVDSDGIYEIVCAQYVSLYGHGDYIGDAKCVLKFNSKAERFEVLEAYFCVNH